MRDIQPVSVRSVTTAFLAAALLSIAAGTVHAETADENALRGAAWDGRLDEVERLLEKGTDPNAPNQHGWTAVHHAADRANARILEALLEAGGNPDAQDTRGSTPLHLAADFPYFEPDSQLSIRVLLSYRADPDLADREDRTPLHLVAANHQQPTGIRDLLASGADANAADRRGDTPLHYAVGRSGKFSADVVAALVDGGADGNVQGGSGETPLQLFVRVGSNDGRIVEALLDAGADVDARNPDGESPLHAAIRNGGSSENNRVVEALLAAGADPCIKDASGYIPYNTAREGGEVHTMLANAGGSDIGCRGSEDVVAGYIVDPADWPGETTARSNIRSGPGTDHDVVRTLDVSTPVHVTGTVRNADWLRVETAGEMAFIHASLVQETAATRTMQSAGTDSTEEPEHENLKHVTGYQMACVSSGGLYQGGDSIDSITVADRDIEKSDIFDLRRHLDSGRCVGYLFRSFTGQCDSLKESCVWPCEGRCRDEGWKLEFEPLSRYDDGGAQGPAFSALADAARSDPDGVIEDSMSQLETVWALTEDMLARTALGEEQTLVAAQIDEEAPAAAETEDSPVSEGDHMAPVETEPKCADLPSGVPWDTVCWRDLTQPSDCLVLLLPYEFDRNSYVNAPEMEELTWSGACEGGVATGEGVMTWTLGGDTVLASHTGQFVDGVRQGHWEEEFDLHVDYYGRELKGPYVDGLRHGDWVEHRWGKGDFHQYDIDEGPYVQGRRSGAWLLRYWIQSYGEKESCNDAEYSDGDQVWASAPYWC